LQSFWPLQEAFSPVASVDAAAAESVAAGIDELAAAGSEAGVAGSGAAASLPPQPTAPRRMPLTAAASNVFDIFIFIVPFIIREGSNLRAPVKLFSCLVPALYAPRLEADFSTTERATLLRLAKAAR
jgi:hypothetical protein